MPESTDAQTATEQAVVIERIFDAPVEMVWRAWTEPEHFKRWMGPKGYTCPALEIDLRVGGKFLGAMRSPEGQDIWSTGVYREIIPFKRLVTTDSFADENGNVVPASHYGIEVDMPLEMTVTVTFEDLGGRTKLTLQHEGMPADGAQGWNESFDKLAAILK
jgi:uncharacterized protein YndB with AHSA1/START domain